jgi:DNA-binding MarR family transcriptional regulator
MNNTQRKSGESQRSTPSDTALRTLYLEALQLVERLHRRLLDVVKDEFDRNGRSDINAIQALLLFNIGNAELTAGELRSRGYYLGSNVSYNLKKLVELGFISHERSRTDRRSVRVSLTEKGTEVAELVAGLYERLPHVRTREPPQQKPGFVRNEGGLCVSKTREFHSRMDRSDLISDLRRQNTVWSQP